MCSKRDAAAHCHAPNLSSADVPDTPLLGMVVAKSTAMAAILCLIFLPLMFATAVLFGTVHGTSSWSSIAAMSLFAIMGFGLVRGMIRISRDWDGEEKHS